MRESARPARARHDFLRSPGEAGGARAIRRPRQGAHWRAAPGVLHGHCDVMTTTTSMTSTTPAEADCARGSPRRPALHRRRSDGQRREGHRRQARRGRAGAGRPPLPGAHADRGRARRRQDHAGQGAGQRRRLHASSASSSRPTCCPPTSPASRSTTSRPASSSSARARSMAQIVLADEINRATPKTQSALLEAMEERQVTVDGVTHPLPAPFMVWRPRTRSSTRAPSRCPRRSSTASCMRDRLGYPEPGATRSTSWPRSSWRSRSRSCTRSLAPTSSRPCRTACAGSTSTALVDGVRRGRDDRDA